MHPPAARAWPRSQVLFEICSRFAGETGLIGGIELNNHLKTAFLMALLEATAGRGSWGSRTWA